MIEDTSTEISLEILKKIGGELHFEPTETVRTQNSEG